MPMFNPDLRMIKDYDFKRLFEKTGNPIFIWFIIWHSIEYNKELPKFALDYLYDISKKILDADLSCDNKNIGTFIFKQLGFSNRKQLQEINVWIQRNKIKSTIDYYMKEHEVSQNKALDALNITKEKSQDFHLIRKNASAKKEYQERIAMYAQGDKEKFDALPVELQCAQKTAVLTSLFPEYEPYGKTYGLCHQCPERFSADCMMTLEERFQRIPQ